MTDVLIVGAGSAGSVLAEQLSADPHCEVTVVESGPGTDDPVIRSLVDDAVVLPIGPGSPVVGRYRSALTRDPATVAEIVRGVCLGGSGAVNGGYFCRALAADFDDPGIPGWSWTEVERHYRAIETDLDFPEFGGTGPIPIGRVREFSASTAIFIDAAQQAGYGWLPDLNAPGTGVGAVPLNILDGQRIGPGAAFLTPAQGRRNLTVLTGIRVTRVRSSGGRVTGIDAIGARGPIAMDCDRVVLAAGAIATAHLLMLSGVGPADQLGACGIDVIADLPVGQRCWDHPEWVVPTARPPTAGLPVLEAVLVTGDLEIRPYTTGFGGRPQPDIGVALMRPRARGRVSLHSADPAVAPRIEHRYDSEPDDLVALQRGCEQVGEILGGTTDLGEPSWSTSQHLSGTAPMGSDEHAVLDPHCRVRGMENLWVIDGSVLPAPLGRGPHATIAMIGHRGAQFVR